VRELIHNLTTKYALVKIRNTYYTFITEIK